LLKKQTLKLKRFRSFSGKCFRFFPVFSGLFPEWFRNKAGKTLKTDRKKAETVLRSEFAVSATE